MPKPRLMSPAKIFKCLAPFIIIALVAPVAACGGGAKTPVFADSETVSAATETSAALEYVPPDIPAKDYGGRSFTFLTSDYYNDNFNLITDDTGDAIDDAAYRRNLIVAEKFNIEFKVSESDFKYAENLKNSVYSGDASYQFVLPHAFTNVASMVADKLLYDWNELPTVDISKPWWNTTMSETLSIGDKLFYASGDIVMTWQGMMGVIFNKEYLEDFNIDADLYQLVYDGKWTFDKMTEIIKGISSDIDGNGIMDKNDRYGLLDNPAAGYSMMYALGQRITKPDADGYPVLDLNTPRMVDIVNKYYELANSGDVCHDSYSSTSYADGTYRKTLIEGRAFLTILDIGGLYNNLREIEFDFGIVPLPKFDEAQENHQVFCGAGLIGIPINIDDPEFVAAVAEEFAYESYLYVRPAFFDVVLQNKAVRDENSYRMLKLMHQSKVFDFGFNFDATGLAFGMLYKVVITNKSTDFVSYYQSVEAQIINGFNKVIDVYR